MESSLLSEGEVTLESLIRKKFVVFLVLIGMCGPQLSIVINHSIRKSTLKNCSQGVDGMVYANHAEYSFPLQFALLLPAPSLVLFTSGI